jgi:hypothetical protein
MRPLEFLSSLFLGMIVGLNTSMSMHGGSLRLLVGEGSKAKSLFHLTKLDRILKIVSL